MKHHALNRKLYKAQKSNKKLDEYYPNNDDGD